MLLRRAPHLGYGMLAIGLATVVGALTVWLAELPPLSGYLFGINVSAFLLCLLDKNFARKGMTRVPEVVLLGSAVMGGTIGLFLGMRLVRHKTLKGSFILALAIIFVLQMGFLRLYFREG